MVGKFNLHISVDMDMDVTTMNGPYWKVTGKSGWQKLTVKFDGSVPLNALKELVGKETTGLAYRYCTFISFIISHWSSL